MLTRAKRGLIIIGNSKTLVNNEHWESWITWVKENNVFVDSQDFLNNI